MSQLALAHPLILQIKRKEKEKKSNIQNKGKEKEKNIDNDLAVLPSHDSSLGNFGFLVWKHSSISTLRSCCAFCYVGPIQMEHLSLLSHIRVPLPSQNVINDFCIILLFLERP